MENIITKNFVEETRKLYEASIKLNPDNEIAEEVLGMSLLINRQNKEYIFFENPILDLIKNYVIDTFDIGMIHFYSDEDLDSTDKYIIIGSNGSGELLAIDKISDNICCIDG